MRTLDAENFGNKIGFQPETLGFLVHPCFFVLMTAMWVYFHHFL